MTHTQPAPSNRTSSHSSFARIRTTQIFMSQTCNRSNDTRSTFSYPKATGSQTLNNMRSNTNTVYSTINNPIVSYFNAIHNNNMINSYLRQNITQISNRNNSYVRFTTNQTNSNNASDQLIDALENLSMNTNQTHQPSHFKSDTDPKIRHKK